MKNRYIYVSFALILISIVLRFSYLSYMEFKADEFQAIKLSIENISEPGIAEVGLKSSQGLYNPPFFIYLISIPTLFSSNPQSITIFVIILNIVGLLLLFHLVKNIFDFDTAVLALLLFSTAPWAIIYSKKIWAQDCLFPFMICLYSSIYYFMKTNRAAYFFLLCLFLSFITQLHMSAWFLPLPLILFFILNKQKINPWYIFIGALIFIIPYIPYVNFHINNDFENIKQFLGSERGGYRTLQHFSQAFFISSGSNFSYLIGKESYKLFEETYYLIIPIIIFGIYYVFSGIASLKVCLTIKFNTLKTSDKFLNLFVLIFFAIQLSYLIFKIGPQPHYHIIFYPILSIFSAHFLKQLYDVITGKLKVILLLIILLIPCGNLYFITSFYNFISHHSELIEGDYGIPYKFTKKLWIKQISVLEKKEL